MCQVGYLVEMHNAQCTIHNYLAEHGISDSVVELASHEECAKNKKTSAATFKTIEEESNKLNQTVLVQGVGNRYVVVNPPYSPMTTEELDAVYALPYARTYHPDYEAAGGVPAIMEEIRDLLKAKSE